ncbi:MAG TPA: ATP-grasp domain-containing protein [Actinomycetota bacterium]|nr:ATP-grasp domain-containing protein [Actinomycetota bacterium]
MKTRAMVLVTGDQGRIGLTTVRALDAAGYAPAVTTQGKHSLAASSNSCVRSVRVPAVDEPGYAEAVRAELASRPYLTCLPVSDSALLNLDYPVRHLLDKTVLARLARDVGLSSPPSGTFSSGAELRAASRGLDYPLVVKPVVRDRRPFRADSAADLKRAANIRGEVMVQPFLNEPIRTVGGVMWQGRMVAAVHQRWHRIWPMPCGQASYAITIAPDEELEERIRLLLSDYDGIFNVQLIGPHLLDVHTRPYGTQSLALAAGVNLAGVWCDLLDGKSVSPARAREGVAYRWLAGDLRHLRWALKSGTMSPAQSLSEFRPRLGTAHGTESLLDPGPIIARIRYHLDGSRKPQARPAPAAEPVLDSRMKIPA